MSQEPKKKKESLIVSIPLKKLNNLTINKLRNLQSEKSLVPNASMDNIVRLTGADNQLEERLPVTDPINSEFHAPAMENHILQNSIKNNPSTSAPLSLIADSRNNEGQSTSGTQNLNNVDDPCFSGNIDNDQAKLTLTDLSKKTGTPTENIEMIVIEDDDNTDFDNQGLQQEDKVISPEMRAIDSIASIIKVVKQRSYKDKQVQTEPVYFISELEYNLLQLLKSGSMNSTELLTILRTQRAGLSDMNNNRIQEPSGSRVDPDVASHVDNELISKLVNQSDENKILITQFYKSLSSAEQNYDPKLIEARHEQLLQIMNNLSKLDKIDKNPNQLSNANPSRTSLEETQNIDPLFPLTVEINSPDIINNDGIRETQNSFHTNNNAASTSFDTNSQKGPLISEVQQIYYPTNPIPQQVNPTETQRNTVQPQYLGPFHDNVLPSHNYLPRETQSHGWMNKLQQPHQAYIGWNARLRNTVGGQACLQQTPRFHAPLPQDQEYNWSLNTPATPRKASPKSKKVKVTRARNSTSPYTSHSRFSEPHVRQQNFDYYQNQQHSNMSDSQMHNNNYYPNGSYGQPFKRNP